MTRRHRHEMARTRYYPPGAYLALPQGQTPGRGVPFERVGGHQWDLLMRCRRSPSWGTLIKQDSHGMRLLELRAAERLQQRGLIQLRIYGGTMVGWLYVVFLTRRGRDCWIGYVPDIRVKWQ
jgi:hypothetical protein